MTLTEARRLVANLGDDEKCPLCKGKAIVPCFAHLAETVSDKFGTTCAHCDSLDEVPGRAYCPCQGE